MELNVAMPSLRGVLNEMGMEWRSVEEKLDNMWYPSVDAVNKKVRYIHESSIKGLYEAEDKAAYYEQKAQVIKPGKFLKKVADADYKAIHRFLAYLEPPTIGIVSGKFASWIYNYKNQSGNAGTLSASCMKHDSCSNYFDIYEKNVDMIVAMKDNLVIGRCILWELDNGQYFADRIYGVEKTVESIKAFCSEHGIWTKVYQTYSDYGIELHGKRASLEGEYLTLKNPIPEYAYTPYMDTFDMVPELEDGMICQLQAGQGITEDALDDEDDDYEREPAHTYDYRLSLKCTAGGNGHRICPTCEESPCTEESHDWNQKVTATCDYCGYEYTKQNYHHIHIKCVRERLYKCTDCGLFHIALTPEEFKNKTCGGIYARYIDTE